MEKVRFTSYITKEVNDKLKELSKETRVPQAQYIQEAIENLLTQYKKPTEK